MNNPYISIIIPTYNSGEILKFALDGIMKQRCPKNYYEIIVADNYSTDNTVEIAVRYGARLIKVGGTPPQVCRQRNLGAENARGLYVLFLDHDVELSENLIGNFVKLIKGGKADADAWYLPYRDIASSKLLTEIRNLEDEFYLNSVVAAARVVKKDFLIRNGVKFDINLSSGPSDWDFDLQLKLKNAKFGILKDYVYHHEEGLSLWKYITKKANYIKGGEIYKNKWEKINPKLFKEVVVKQYNPFHRLVWIFVERGKWKKLLPKLHIYLLFLITKFMMAAWYWYKLSRQEQ